jgi:hypothetical protein
MNTKDLKDPILSDLADRYPAISRRMKRNGKTGCLEYREGMERSIGNPLITLKIRGKVTTKLLRRYLWEKYHGPVPDGKFPHMRCGNRRCHAYLHMGLRKGFGHYTPCSSEYTERFNKKFILTINYYRNKLSIHTLASAFNITHYIVKGLWNSKISKSLSLPRGWHPDPESIKRIELASAISRGQRFFLGDKNRSMAEREIRKSKLPPLQKSVLLQMVQGKSKSDLSRESDYSKNGIMYLYRRSLVQLEREIGERWWIYICSKGRIEKWRKSIIKSG